MRLLHEVAGLPLARLAVPELVAADVADHPGVVSGEPRPGADRRVPRLRAHRLIRRCRAGADRAAGDYKGKQRSDAHLLILLIVQTFAALGSACPVSSRVFSPLTMRTIPPQTWRSASSPRSSCKTGWRDRMVTCQPTSIVFSMCPTRQLPTRTFTRPLPRSTQATVLAEVLP